MGQVSPDFVGWPVHEVQLAGPRRWVMGLSFDGGSGPFLGLSSSLYNFDVLKGLLCLIKKVFCFILFAVYAHICFLISTVFLLLSLILEEYCGF